MAMIAWTLGAGTLPAQDVIQPVIPVVEEVPWEISADRLEYEADSELLRAESNVNVEQGDVSLSADYAQINRVTKVVIASGNVVLKRGTDIWEGEELTYNFQSKKGFTSGFNAFTDPFYVTAESAERASDGMMMVRNATLSTCEGPNPEFRIKARSASIEDGNTIRARGVTFYLGRVPFLYLPYVKRDSRGSGLDLVPGYSSRSGAFLLSAYNYPINDTVMAATHLDIRAERGVGVGQDLAWKDPEGKYEGNAKVYYTKDKKPFDDDEEEGLYGDLIDENRGLLGFSHYQSLTERDYVIADVNWLSDPDVLEDFFDNDFRYGAQPENRVSLTHRGDHYTANLLVNGKLNDFFDSVNRLPEASVDINRIRMGNSGFYYEGVHTGAGLQQDYADSVPTNQTPRLDYESLRMDTANRVLYPTRHFGFLNMIPRAGYRATYYSKTRETIVTSEEVADVDEAGNPIIRTVETSVDQDQGAALRNLFDLGLESSFKAFKVFHEHPLWGSYEGLRHVAEPFLDYTYVPEPNLRPSELYQFDAVDRLDKRNDLRVGMRNKFQTRRKGKYLHDIIDAEIWTIYSLEAEPGANDFAPLIADIEVRPVDSLALDFELAYDFEDSVLDEFNSQLAYVARDRSRASVEYRFRDQSRDQISGALDLFPNARWSLGTYWRYAMDRSELEEQEYIVRTKSSCLGYGLGYRQITREGADDHQVWAMIWLLAFPDTVLSLGR